MIVVLVLAFVADAANGSAVSTAGSAAARRPTVALTVVPGRTVQRGTSITVSAVIQHTGARGVVRFYDGSWLMATKQRTHGQLSVAWITGGLKTGVHRIRATFSVAAHRRPVATSPVVTITVTGSPTIDDQTIVVRVPEHRMPKPTARPVVLRTAQVRPPLGVLGTDQGRGGVGGLAYTGVNAIFLLVLALVLLLTGGLLRASGRERLRRGLRVAAGTSATGALAFAAIFATGSDAISAPAADLQIVGTPAPLASLEWPGGSPPSVGVSGATGGAQMPRGARVTLLADGFRPGEHVVVALDDRIPLPDAVADVDGRLRYRLTVAPDTSPGPHTVKLTGSLLHDAVVLVVTAPG